MLAFECNNSNTTLVLQVDNIFCILFHPNIMNSLNDRSLQNLLIFCFTDEKTEVERGLINYQMLSN